MASDAHCHHVLQACPTKDTINVFENKEIDLSVHEYGEIAHFVPTRRSSRTCEIGSSKFL